MTDEESVEPAEPDVDDAQAQAVSRIQYDEALVFLVYLANRAGVELGVRLFVNGVILSGTLVSGGVYFDRLRDEVANSGAGTGSEVMASVFESFAAPYRDTSEDDGGPESVGYIHLKDAWTYTPGQSPMVVGLWRGVISSVSGWSLGVYGTTDS